MGIRKYRLEEVPLNTVELDSNHASERVSATREGYND